MLKKLHIAALGAILLTAQGCYYTRHVPDGSKLLWKNEIEVNGKSGVPGSVSNIIKQQPNARFWMFSIGMGLYGYGDGTDSSFFGRIGDAPVVLDTMKTRTGAAQLQNYYFNKGYFNARSDYEILDHRRNQKKAIVKYEIETGDRYFIKDFSMDIGTPEVRELAQYFSDRSLIKVNDPYDAAVLDNERKRLTDILLDHGYYNFPKNYITFEADTFLRGDSVNIQMIIAQKPMQSGDSLYYGNHEKYTLNEVYIRPDNDYLSVDQPDDTTRFLNYNVVYDSLLYKPRYLTDAIHFKKGDLYRSDDIKDTYTHLIGYKAFQLTEIDFFESGRDSNGLLLNAYVKLKPLQKSTFTVEPEATTTNGNFGINGSIGWINRNFLKAGEAFEIRLNSGLEYQANPNSDVPSETFEVGGEISLSFPRFVLPFNTVGLLPKRMRPESQISLSINRLSRFEFDRETFRAKLSYTWKESSKKTHQLSLTDISYSRLFDIDEFFFLSLSPIQQNAFRSELISATRYSYTYNQQVDPTKVNHNFLQVTGELAGNVLSLLDEGAGVGEEDPDFGTRNILNVWYSQYFRVEGDYRFYWNFSPGNSWINRVYVGAIFPYGNSVIDTDSGSVRLPPFSKFFFMGGSTDLRAWPAYRLGAGSQANTNYLTGDDTTFATGTIKLLINSEYRFPIYSSLKGAAFIDIGNIWLRGSAESDDPDARFDLSRLLDQLAIGTGVGVRLDLSFLVVRFDIGMKVRDPYLTRTNEEWVIFTQPFAKNWTYNIALGYPF